ncbi:hypothetical protein SK128_002896, partial [Halocaridina rubra]
NIQTMVRLQKAQGWVTRACTKIDCLLARSPMVTTSKLVDGLEELDKSFGKIDVQSEIELASNPEELEDYLD